MPITLIVRLPGAKDAAHKLTFDGERVVLGRGDTADLRLPDPSVSHRHATLRAKGAEYTLVDEGSTNGTFIGGVRLLPSSPRIVKSGDLLRVGRVWIEVRMGELAATPDLALATRDLALALVSQAMHAIGDDVIPKVRVVEGPDLGAVLVLNDEGRTYVVGRGDRCDLLLADVDASREHLQVVRRGATVMVRDAGAKNGVQMGDSKLARGRDVVWRSPTMLRLAGTVLALDEPVALALSELESGADEALKPGEAPKEPTPSVRPKEGTDPGGPQAAPEPGPAAPMADVPELRQTTQPAARGRKKGGVSPTDALVVVAAIFVIAISAAALIWLLRG
jgi:pSer/pThr/pTyr-binding forkhead associated (FHA) protein